MQATKLDRLIEKEYGREFGIVEFMEGQELLRVTITEIWEDQKEYVENFVAGVIPPFEEMNVLEALLCDLCSKGKLKAGKRLIEY